MYERESYIHNSIIDNQPLISCTLIAESVKAPPRIPYYEAYTYALIARYFDLTEKRVRNAYVSNRERFLEDSVIVSGKEILHHVRDYKSLGRSYGHLCEFTNGVVAQISYGTNMLFNDRALIRFAVIFKNESDVAKQIYDILDRNSLFGGYGQSDRRRIPWFYDFSPLHTVDKAKSSPSVVCPYLATMSETEKARDAKPVKMQAKVERGGIKKINQLDKNDNVVCVWNSATEAAHILGINVNNIYHCLAGLNKTTGSSKKGAEGKYRFAYAD